MTIRVGIIGLSANAAGTSWASTAHLPYFLSSGGKEHYKIVALANTSVASAQASIKKYELDPSTKAYGDVQDLANDPDVDLVVVSTRVDDHYKTGLPSVKAGKAVFIEWPLAQDAKHAKELVDAAKASGSKTIVGAQGRYSPPIVKLKELIDNGDIGEVLSSEIVAAGGTWDRVKLASSLAYFTDKAVGGNPITIGFGHLWSPAQFVLGEVSDIQSRTQIQRPKVQLTDGDRKVLDEVTTNVPDLVNVTGTLAAHNNATLTFRYRRGQQFKDSPALTWTVNGEKGEAKLTAWEGAGLNAGGYGKGVTVEVHDFETDTLKNYEWKWEDWQEELPVVARNIAKTYDAFAKGESVPTFEEALRRHEQIDAILQ